MHPRNIFKLRPPKYEELARKYPEFRSKCFIGAGGKICVNFHDPEAVRLIAEILLSEYFELNVIIPPGVLVPRIPQRLNYILLLEDLIYHSKNTIHDPIIGIDIGAGTSCIFPLLGSTLNQWKFVATDISEKSCLEAQENVRRNSLDKSIEVIHTNPDTIFREIFSDERYADVIFTFSMCNPPFFDIEEAEKKFLTICNNEESLLNNQQHGKRGPPHSATTATKGEISYDGGEFTFVQKIIEESEQFPNKIKIYTTMVGKLDSLHKLKKILKEKKIKNSDYTLSQGKGRTSRWVLAWTFMENIDLITFTK